MRMKSRGVSASRLALPRLVLAFLLPLLLPLMICPVLGDGDVAVPDGADEGNESRAAERKHHKHHLLLFMGGLKSLAAVVLIKIKIVLVVAAIVAVVVFTIKYLLGAAGLPDPAGLFHKGSNYFAPPPPPPQQPPQYPEPYHSVVHEPLYGYGYPTPIPWDQANQESYESDWHKYGDGGRSLLDITSFYPSLQKVLVQNSFKHKRKRIKRKSNVNFKDNKR